MSFLSVCAHCLLSGHRAPLRKVWLHLPYSPQVTLCKWIRFPWDFLSPNWAVPILSTSPFYESYSTPLTVFVIVCLTHFSVSVSLLYRKSHSCTQDFRGGLTSAEWRGMITFLSVLAILCLMHLSLQLTFFVAREHSWLMFSFISTRTPRTLFAWLLSSCAWNYSSPWGTRTAGARFPLTSWDLYQPIQVPLKQNSIVLQQQFLPVLYHVQKWKKLSRGWIDSWKATFRHQYELNT